MAQTAENVFRDFTTDGVPSSGKHAPKKAEIRELLTGYESTINAFTSNGGLVYATKAQLDADRTPSANSSAWVIGDSVVANNGIYRKAGASGAGSWSRVGDLPYSFIRASNTGAGMPNAIKATSSVPIPAADGGALVTVNVTAENTGPATIAFNGGAPLAIVGIDGLPLAAGDIVADLLIAGYKSGDSFRLITDPSSLRNKLAAEAAQVESEVARVGSEAARDIAVNAASDAVSQGSVPIYATATGMPALSVPVGISALRVNGYAAAGDGGAALYKKAAGQPAHAGKFKTVDGAWWELAEALPNVKQFGAVMDGVANDTTAVTAAVAYAKLIGSELSWPGVTALTTVSIPSFHEVRHTGFAAIKRGDELFYITPLVLGGVVQENHIYYSLSGSTANDGLSPSEPRADLSQFREDLRRYDQQGKLLGGKWAFHFGAGSWVNTQLRLNFEVSTTYPIRIVGERDNRSHEIASYGGFGLASAWQSGGSTPPTISSGQAVFSGGAFDTLIQTVPPLVGLTAGASYELKFEIVNYVSGGVTPRLGASSGTDVSGTLRNANGVYTQTLVANGTSDQIKFTAASFVGRLKNVSVKKITAAGAGGPATVFNSLASLTTAVAWADGGVYLVENIAFVGAGRSTTTYGWLQQGDGNCELINCRAENVSLGLAAIDGRRIKTSNCLAKNCDQGFRAHYGTKITFGNSAENYNRAMECDIGVFVSRNSIGHVDYMVVDDAALAGLWLDTGAPRVNLVGSDFRRCAVGVEAQSNSEWLNEPDGSATANNFNMGTPDACGIAYRHNGGAIETRLYGQQSQTERRIGYDRTLITHTGTTTQTTLVRVASRTRFTLPAYFFGDPSKKLRLRIWGSKIGTAGSKTITVAVTDAGTGSNKQTIASAAISAAAGAYMIEFEISPTSFTAQKQSSVCWLDGANPVVNPASARAASMTVDREIRIDSTLANAADSVTIEGYDCFLMG